MKRIRILVILLVFALCASMTACSADNGSAAAPSAAGTEAAASYRQVDAAEAIRLMETEKDWILLDVRTEEEFAAGHIPGAICIPNETIGSDRIPALPDKGQLILVYCRSGRRSKEAAQKLTDLGYTDIVEFGGIIDWPGETTGG